MENVHVEICGTKAEVDDRGDPIAPANTNVINRTRKNDGCWKTVYARPID